MARQGYYKTDIEWYIETVKELNWKIYQITKQELEIIHGKNKTQKNRP